MGAGERCAWCRKWLVPGVFGLRCPEDGCNCGKEEKVKDTQVYVWRVELMDNSCEVEGRDKVEASHRAAARFGVNWRSTARSMVITKLRKARNADL